MARKPEYISDTHYEFKEIGLGIMDALKKSPYCASDTIDILEICDELREQFKSKNSIRRPYSLRLHTEIVCNNFENYFTENILYSEFSLSSYRLLLCLHDAGKPQAIHDGDKSKQHENSIKWWSVVAPHAGLTEEEVRYGAQLISRDPIGLYLRSKINLEMASDDIRAMHAAATGSLNQFFQALTILYQVDAAAYTSVSYRGPIEHFLIKPSLERLFLYRSGDFVKHRHGHRLIFSEPSESMFRDLERKLTS